MKKIILAAVVNLIGLSILAGDIFDGIMLDINEPILDPFYLDLDDKEKLQDIFFNKDNGKRCRKANRKEDFFKNYIAIIAHDDCELVEKFIHKTKEWVYDVIELNERGSLIEAIITANYYKTILKTFYDIFKIKQKNRLKLDRIDDKVLIPHLGLLLIEFDENDLTHFKALVGIEYWKGFLIRRLDEIREEKASMDFQTYKSLLEEELDKVKREIEDIDKIRAAKQADKKRQPGQGAVKTIKVTVTIGNDRGYKRDGNYDNNGYNNRRKKSK